MTLAVAATAAPKPAASSIIPPLRPIPQRKPNGRRVRARTTDGRWHDTDPRARIPAGGFGTAPSPNVQIQHGTVADPMEAKASSIVSVNLRTDLLEWEYSHRQLSEAAYRTGREIQGLWERATRIMGSSWDDSSGGPPASSADRLAAKMELAEQIAALEKRIVRAIGMVGYRRLRSHLAHGLTFAQAAIKDGKGDGREAIKFAAKRFRHYLEDLAEEWAARGAA